MKRVISFLMVFSIFIGYAQNWNSEEEINNHYNNQINEVKREIEELKRQKDRLTPLDKVEQGDFNSTGNNFFDVINKIARLEQIELPNLERGRSAALENFRQIQKDKQEAERQIEERKRRNTERQREIQEDNQKRVDEQNRNREEEARRREERRKEEERKRQEAINEAIQDNRAINAPAYYRDLSQYDENARNVAELKYTNISNISSKHSKSGYMPSSGRKLVGTSRHNQPGALAKKYLKRKQDQTQNDDWLRSLEIECNKLNY